MSFDNFGIVIPARIKSSRLPRKPLVKILGVPLIQRVWERAVKFYEKEKVWVATDSPEIMDLIKSLNGNAIMTSSNCKTGLDRVAEANETLNFDYILNLQGDEPLITKNIIDSSISYFKNHGPDALNCMSKVNSIDDFYNTNTIKVVTDKDDELLYMSRSPIPFGKDKNISLKNVYKQVCVYILNKKSLAFYGPNKYKSSLESIEDIEILRLLSMGVSIKMLEVEAGSIAVDVESDIQKVENFLSGL